MNLSKFKFLILVAFPLLLIPTHVLSKTDTRKTRGDTLVIGDIFKPTIINPILTHSSISAVLKRIIFDGLIKLNDKMEPVPHLALSWENSADGLTWVFHLRRDVRFHDGSELTSQDVKFTFDKINDPSIKSPYISIFGNFKAVRARDKYVVEIHLKNPFPSLLFYLEVGILPKHLLVGKDLRKAEFNYRPVGTGPFKMQRWTEDEIVLKAHEDYFEGKPHLSQVIVRSFNDQRVVWAELMKGTLDCVLLIYPKNYDIIEKIPEFKVYSFLNPYYYIVAFNEDNTLFRKNRVRQALNYAVDKERLVWKVLRGRGRVSSGPIYPQTWAYSKAIEPYPYDPKKAAKLLEKEEAQPLS
jgi:peptide/nickel transport system substrate-binding protein